MKYAVPEISWHNRDPVLSVDIQPQLVVSDPLRLATGGTDSHVLIWHLSTSDSGAVNLEVAADLTRHQKAVNVVRWSPNGQYLASGDDESIIFIWRQNTEKEVSSNSEQGDEQYKESWVIHKTLRGHMEDVLDISWSPDSLFLASGSVDNKLLIWDVSRGRYSAILSDHKGFVQGVSWDPKGQYIASASSDRTFRTFDIASKKVVSRSSKATLPLPTSHPLHGPTRLYHDDTLQTFYRRLQFSPDGLLIAVPAGWVEPLVAKPNVKPIHAVYIYTRYYLKVPACVIPCDAAALAVRWSPSELQPRSDGPPPALPTPRRLLAVATTRSLLLYDTTQRAPLAVLSHIHYTRLTDLTWSTDASTLVASSTDGFCSVVSFAPGELGLPVPPQQDDAMEMDEPQPIETPAQGESSPPKTPNAEEKKAVANGTPKIDTYMKFKSPKKAKIEKKNPKTPVKIDLMEEVAMPSWSDNSNSDVVKPKTIEESIIIEDSEDIKLVYEETEQNKSTESDTEKPSSKSSVVSNKQTEEPKISETPITSLEDAKERGYFLQQAKVTDVTEAAVVPAVPSPKAPRRVTFVTLSSPKNSKKKL